MQYAKRAKMEKRQREEEDDLDAKFNEEIKNFGNDEVI